MTDLVPVSENVEGPTVLDDDKAKKRWLEQRRQFITATDAPVILGVSPFSSPLALFTKKLGLVEDEEETLAMELGTFLQPFVLRRLAKESGRRVHSEAPWTLIVSKDVTWAAASLDGRVEGGGVAEAKTGGEFRVSDWDGEPPVYVVAQVQHQLMVTGEKLALIGALLGNRTFLWCELKRDDLFIEKMLKAEEEFLGRLKRKEPPDPDGSDSSLRAVKALYPKDAGHAVQLSGQAAEHWTERVMVKQQISKLEVLEKELRARIALEIKTASYGILPGGQVLSFKEKVVPAHHRDESRFRELRAVKGIK